MKNKWFTITYFFFLKRRYPLTFIFFVKRSVKLNWERRSNIGLNPEICASRSLVVHLGTAREIFLLLGEQKVVFSNSCETFHSKREESEIWLSGSQSKIRAGALDLWVFLMDSPLTLLACFQPHWLHCVEDLAFAVIMIFSHGERADMHPGNCPGCHLAPELWD